MNPGSPSLKENNNSGKKQRNVCELTFFFVILVLTDKAMLKCVLKCSTTAERTFENRGRWHCAYCFQICERKNAMTVHLNTHSKVNVSVPLITKERPKNKSGHSRAAPQAEKSSSSSTEAKIECPQCSKAYTTKPCKDTFGISILGKCRLPYPWVDISREYVLIS